MERLMMMCGSSKLNIVQKNPNKEAENGNNNTDTTVKQLFAVTILLRFSLIPNVQIYFCQGWNSLFTVRIMQLSECAVLSKAFLFAVWDIAKHLQCIVCSSCQQFSVQW